MISPTIVKGKKRKIGRRWRMHAILGLYAVSYSSTEFPIKKTNHTEHSEKLTIEDRKKGLTTENTVKN